MGKEMDNRKAMLYQIDEKPKSLGRSVTLGFQQVMIMFGSTITVPLLLGPAMGATDMQIAIMISSVMICSGLATLVQLKFGSKLPIIQGVTYSFLPFFFAVIASGYDVPTTMQYIAGALLLGALVEITIGFSGIFGLIKRFITPVVIGPTIALIGLSMYEVGAPQAGENWFLAILVIALIFLFSLVMKKSSFVSLYPILLAIASVYGLCLVLSLSGVYTPDAPGYIDLSSIGEASWTRKFSLGNGGVFFPWGIPKFNLGFFLAILAAYVVSMVESFGDYHAIASISYAPVPSNKQINRGLGAEGIGCFITSLLGGFATTSYGENIGAVGITRVASKFVFYLAALIMILLGLCEKFGALMGTIPAPVLGGVYCVLFAMMGAVGLGILGDVDMKNSVRNRTIVGFTLFMGLSVPVYFDANPLVMNPDWLANVINSIGTTPMAVGVIVGLLLDNIIPGTTEERGSMGGSNEITEAIEKMDKKII